MLVSLLLPSVSLTQGDPNRDGQLDVLPPEAFQQRGIPAELTVITDEQGFDNFDLGVDFAEPHMSSNPLNPLQYFNAFNTNGTHHTEDGHDWTTNNPAFPTTAGDPASAYDSLGNLYYMTMRTDAGGGIIGTWVVKSTNNGASWGPAVASVAGFDKCWMAADQTSGPYGGYVYGVMTPGNFSRTTNGGTSWVQTWTFGTQTLPGMMVAVGPNVIGGDTPGGCVYVVTNSGSSVASTYTFYVSTNGGASFTLKSAQNWANYVGTFVGGRNSVENFRTRPYPFIAADNSYGPYRGRFYCIYASNDPPGNGNKPDIWIRYSDDQGATWSAASIINDDPTPQTNHQWHPSIWTDLQTGRLYVKWLDTRNCAPLDDSTDVYATYSDDGGVTWAPSQRLTTEIFKIDCATCGGGGTPRYLGDYDAITSFGDQGMAVWTDFRDGNFKSMTAYFPDYAMLLSESADTSGVTDVLDVMVSVPAVKLYTNPVTFSASVDPAENFTFDFPSGNTLTSYPDSLPLSISWSGVAEGTYTVTVQGEGPNGIPLHRRTIEILVTSPFVTVLSPNGGESIFTGTTYPISWVDGLVDTVKLEYSTDNGSSWITIVDSVQSRTGDGVLPPKARARPGLLGPVEATTASYLWLVPFTASDNCLIRISHYTDGNVSDVSDAVFSIVDAPAPQWRAQTSPNSNDLYSVSVLDTSTAWAAGVGGTVLKTFNGGNTWTATLTSAGADVYCIEAIDATKVLVGTYDSGTSTTKIRRTQNGGLTWTDVYTDASAGAFINAIHMFDALNGYAEGDPVGGQWTLLRTTDGGLTWNSAATLAQDGSEAGWNNSMDWTDDLHGWFGTGNSRVYYSTDGGSTWSFGSTNFANSFGVGFETDNLTGAAVGSDVDLSLDGGATWTTVPGGPGVTASAVSVLNVDAFIPNRDPIWYVTAGSFIYKSDDQGFFVLDHTQANTYNHLEMRTDEVGGNNWVVGYAVGDAGTITKYTELLILTDVRQVGNQVPSVFSLSQNYPNPFNPTTAIHYGLPVQSNVSLRIYNVLGQEVVTLLEGAHPAGNYQAVWDGRNEAGESVGSGVYFYRLEASSDTGENFASLRKMILMK
jgi:photosystem II stability/assembly factor-like uncharacterized protein